MLVSFRSLMSFSRPRPIRPNSMNSSGRRARAAGPSGSARTLRRAGVEVLEDRGFLAADVPPPVADSFVRDPSFNRTNFGNSPFLYVKTAGSGDSRVAYLKFDVSNWSSGQIGNATLYLAGALQTPSTPTIPVAVYPVADSN